MNEAHAFSPAERAAVYRAIAERRDMRHFIPGTRVPEATLRRLLEAAHQAPSVGLMQPWRILGPRGARRGLHAPESGGGPCAIQNLWLAARAEGLGMGWVSLFEPAELSALLHLPAGALPIALLCLGPVRAFYPAPMLALEGWRQPRPLAEMVMENRWGDP